MVRLGGGADILRHVAVLAAVTVPGRSWRGWFEQRAAQVLEQPESVAAYGQAAPTSGAAVQYGPGQGEAAGLAGEPADDLGAAAGLAEGALDEAGVPDTVLRLLREPQIGGQSLAVGEQAPHRCRVGRAYLAAISLIR
jgi:hypothetical protein